MLLVAFVMRFFIFQPFVVEGQSMEPNFHNNEYLLVQKLSYRLNNPQRGDVIIFQAPTNLQSDYIKRVIALPGETVKIVNNKIYVNGTQITEDYLPKNDLTLINQDPNLELEQTMGANQYFVLGDNREHSSDSREFGVVDKSLIIGKVFVTVYPWQYFSFLPKVSY